MLLIDQESEVYEIRFCSICDTNVASDKIVMSLNSGIQVEIEVDKGTSTCDFASMLPVRKLQKISITCLELEEDIEFTSKQMAEVVVASSSSSTQDDLMEIREDTEIDYTELAEMLMNNMTAKNASSLRNIGERFKKDLSCLYLHKMHELMEKY